MLRIEMLPAENGDCLWIEYGEWDNPLRILIDGGTHRTYDALRERMERVDAADRRFQLLTITHIDNDHIDGIVRLLQNPQIAYSFRDIWYNGWPHLDNAESDALGPVQGEYVAARIRHDGLPWNDEVAGAAVAIAQEGRLPRVTLPGGLELVLLSPTPEKLERLRKKWRKVITDVERDYPDPGSAEDWLLRLEDDARYDPDDDGDLLGDDEAPDVEALSRKKTGYDRSAANGSSIAFLLEYEGKRVLLAGDAHATVLANSVELYLEELDLDRLPLDAFKLPHHGSKKNLTKRLLGLIDCRRYLVSTNGRRHHHPNDEAMARVLAHGGEEKALIFNYRVPRTEKWDDAELRAAYGYTTRYPPLGREGIALEL